MHKIPPAASPAAYVAALTGWRARLVKTLRAAVRKAKPDEEVIKWGHIVYLTNGPLALIRAEETRILFGFWRGKRLTDLEPRLKPGGKFEMATLQLGEGDSVSAATATKLMRAAIALNKSLGNPTALPARRRGPVKKAKPRR